MLLIGFWLIAVIVESVRNYRAKHQPAQPSLEAPVSEPASPERSTENHSDAAFKYKGGRGVRHLDNVTDGHSSHLDAQDVSDMTTGGNISRIGGE